MTAWKRLAIAMVVLVASAAPTIAVAPAAAAPPCDAGPTVPPSSARTNLDDDAQGWGVFCDGGFFTWRKDNVPTPSRDGRALRCEILSGVPGEYGGLHCYRNLTSRGVATRFTLKLSFLFRPEVTCNNEVGDSVVQALEFTMSRWRGGARHEFALQWENVAAESGSRGEQWRYWTGAAWQPLSPPVGECLEPNVWHELELRGHIVDNKVRYDSFMLDGTIHSLGGVTVDPVAEPGDITAVAVQLDENETATPYELIVDRVELSDLPAPEYTGSAWFSDGSTHKAGPAGTAVTLYGTRLRPNTTYMLVTGSSGGVANEPCGADPVPINRAVRTSSSSGFIGATTGPITRPPGTWDVCFWEVTPGNDGRSVSAPKQFTVS